MKKILGSATGALKFKKSGDNRYIVRGETGDISLEINNKIIYINDYTNLMYEGSVIGFGDIPGEEGVELDINLDNGDTFRLGGLGNLIVLE